MLFGGGALFVKYNATITCFILIFVCSVKAPVKLMGQTLTCPNYTWILKKIPKELDCSYNRYATVFLSIQQAGDPNIKTNFIRVRILFKDADPLIINEENTKKSLDAMFVHNWMAHWEFNIPQNNSTITNEVILELTYAGENDGVYFDNTDDLYRIFTLEFTKLPGFDPFFIELDNLDSYLKKVNNTKCNSYGTNPKLLFLKSKSGIALQIAGDIEYMNNQTGACRVNNGFPNLRVEIQEPAMTSNILALDYTKDNGHYLCKYLRSTCEMRIQPDMGLGMDANGVNTRDIVFIQLHLLGKKPFTESWQYIAGDVNLNGVVSVADIVVIRKLVLGKIHHFKKAWRFIDEDRYNEWESQGGPPMGFQFNDYIQRVYLSNAFDEGFKGIKVGEITGEFDVCTFSFTGNDNNDTRSEKYYYTAKTESAPLSVNQNFTTMVPAYMICTPVNSSPGDMECSVYLDFNGESAGIMELNLPQNISVNSVELFQPEFGDNIEYALNEDETVLRFTWVDEISTDVPVAKIHIHRDITQAPMIWSQVQDADYNNLSDGDTDYGISFQSYDLSNHSGIQISLTPNPFASYPNLVLISKSDKKVRISIHSPSSKKVYSMPLQLHQGFNQIALEALMYSPKGLYMIEVYDKDEIKMVKGLKF